MNAKRSGEGHRNFSHFIVMAALFAILVPACTVNVNTQAPELRTTEEQNFLACELWVDSIGDDNGGTLMTGETEVALGHNVKILTGYLEELEGVNSTLALQVKRHFTEMLDYNETYLSTGEFPQDLFDRLLVETGAERDAMKQCNELVGFRSQLIRDYIDSLN